MGWIRRAAACALLLGATHADAGGRIAYPSPGQMYVMLATDVRVTFGTTIPTPGVVAEPVSTISPVLFDLISLRRRFAPPIILQTRVFVPSAGVPVSADPSPMILATRAESFRQDLFPEQQRVRLASPMDAMLTFSIGGTYGPNGNLCLEGGVAGAVWRMSHTATDLPATP